MSRPFDQNSRELSNDIWLSICAYELVLTRLLKAEEAYPGSNADASDERISSLKERLKAIENSKHYLLLAIATAES